MANFGDRLNELRNEKRLTQEQLANKFYLNKSSISRYERGQQVPELELLQQIADFFEVTTDYLLGNSDIRNPYKENKEEQQLPEYFETPEEAIDFLLKQNVIMGFGGFDVDKLSDEEKVEFANSLLEHLKLLSLKYKK